MLPSESKNPENQPFSYFKGSGYFKPISYFSHILPSCIIRAGFLIKPLTALTASNIPCL
jgi:hypothetical protein